MGAASQNGSWKDIAWGAAIGGGVGLGIGLIDPSLGFGTLAVIGGLAGGTGDLLGQVIAIHDDPCKRINWGSTIGAVAGGAAAGYGGVALSPWNDIIGEWTATTLANAFFTVPVTVFPIVGGDMWDRLGN